MPNEETQEQKEAREAQETQQRQSSQQNQQNQQQPDPNMVSLTKEQYSAILDRMDELEQLVTSKEEGKSGGKGRQQSTVDDLAEEGRSGKGRQESQKVDLESMSNTELVQFVFKTAEEQVVQPLTMQIQTLKVMNEIDKVALKHDDFYDYQGRIKEIAIENPTLSIEKAYKMAKLEAKEEEEEGSGSEEGQETKQIKKQGPAKQAKGVKLLLPPRPTLGERPGTAGAATRQGPAKTLKQAAERAWDDVMGSGRESA